MAKERCVLCNEEVDIEYYLVKKCSKCGSWFCQDHLGQCKWQCVLCLTYTLSNTCGT